MHTAHNDQTHLIIYKDILKWDIAGLRIDHKSSILYVQEFLTHFYSIKMGQDFLDICVLSVSNGYSAGLSSVIYTFFFKYPNGARLLGHKVVCPNGHSAGLSSVIYTFFFKYASESECLKYQNEMVTRYI